MSVIYILRVYIYPTISLYAQNGCTALIGATKEGHTECVRLLLQAGADTDAKEDSVRDIIRYI